MLHRMLLVRTSRCKCGSPLLKRTRDLWCGHHSSPKFPGNKLQYTQKEGKAAVAHSEGSSRGVDYVELLIRKYNILVEESTEAG